MRANDRSVVYYLRSHEEMIDQELIVLGAGRYVSPAGASYPPPGHPPLYQFRWQCGRVLPEFHALIVSEGEGEIEFAHGEKLAFKAPSMILIPPGVWHRYRPSLSKGWTERWISFSGSFAYRHFDITKESGSLIKLDSREAGNLVSDFDDLVSAVERYGAIPFNGISYRALEIVSLIARLRWQYINSSPSCFCGPNTHNHIGDPIVLNALEIIWSASHPLCSVRDIVRQLPVSRRTLDQRFRKACGRTVLEEISVCRHTRAKRLLQSTDLPIKTVAHLAGFSSPERMRVSFVQNEDMSPLAYRQQMSVKAFHSPSHDTYLHRKL